MTRIPVPRLLLPLLAVASLLGACVPALLVTGAAGTAISYHDRRSTGIQADDETSEWRGRNRVPSAYSDSANVNFTAFNRNLLVTGEVPNAQARADIGDMAERIEGIRRVHNELQIAAVSTLGSRSNDVFISSKYKARLLDNDRVASNHIKPVTENGVLFLMGIVNEGEAVAAVNLARTTAGVRKVVNLLEVLPDADIRRIDEARFGTR
ncbi:BON domain-containing protein [Dechloromonas sp. CZR5]|uniref:BON domain-containing protein n=1 Tax=Dechloromonas sp. CZR5 TaxID=2608630 RepID=UPI00123CE38F|nr:BON domain-containing protein [Dechloromonas sp. CZR5]